MIAATRLDLAAVQQNIAYKRELLAGDIVEISSALVEIRDKSISSGFLPWQNPRRPDVVRIKPLISAGGGKFAAGYATSDQSLAYILAAIKTCNSCPAGVSLHSFSVRICISPPSA